MHCVSVGRAEAAGAGDMVAHLFAEAAGGRRHAGQLTPPAGTQDS